MTKAKKTTKADALDYEAETLINAKRFIQQRDLLAACLDQTKRYTMAQVESLLKEMEGE